MPVIYTVLRALRQAEGDATGKHLSPFKDSLAFFRRMSFELAIKPLSFVREIPGR